ncbi:MAG: LapA family protein [Desulfobacteraceae bacterium]|jgi:hypothetical protein
MTHLKVIVFILIGLVVVILAVQNNEAMSTSVHFRIDPVFFEEKRATGVSVYQVAIIAFLLGVLSTGIYGMAERFRLKKKIKTLTRELQVKDQELNSLRNLPITHDDVSSDETESA